MKTKTRKELKRENKELWVFFTIAMIGIVILGLYGIYKGIRVEKLQTQLSECQDKIPETQFWSCPGLLEKGMYSLRDGGILISPSGKELKCEVIE